MNARVNRVLFIFLVASVCFNAFFTFGFIRARATLRSLRTDEGRVRLIARQLDLSKKQEEELVRLRRQLQEEINRYDRENAAETDAFWEEMSKDDPDIEKIREMLAASAQKREALRTVKIEYMRRAFPLLTPTQRKALARMIRDRSFYKNL